MGKVGGGRPVAEHLVADEPMSGRSGCGGVAAINRPSRKVVFCDEQDEEDVAPGRRAAPPW